jgi:hypothetical protein
MQTKELLNILKYTPVEQPILLEGIHGIGKSEFIDQFGVLTKSRVVKIFLGQLSDSGDVIGLPQRVEVTTPDGKKITITEFCPPYWWPTDENESLIIFLDELNRAKPELLNAIMDMVLNRKLAGRALPKKTRVMAAINPLDMMYQVEDMDPALLDRFNKYIFQPDFEEWMEWCVKNGVPNLIIGFISKNMQHLDPPEIGTQKSGEVYPSRRSWKRVADIMNTNSELLEEPEYKTLRNIVQGIIGVSAVSSFINYLKEENKGITPGKILLNWDAIVEKKIKNMKVQEHAHLNKQIVMYLEQHEADLDTKVGSTIAINLEYYLKSVSAEINAEFFNALSTSFNQNKKWGEKLFNLNPTVSSRYLQVMHGQTKEDKKLKENLEN